MSKFVKVEDPSHILPTVEGRLPAASGVFNQLTFYHKLKSDLDILTYGKNKPESLWVITKYKREDWGPWISICPPNEEYVGEVPEDVKLFLISGEIFNWMEDFVITSPMHVSKFIMNLNLNELGHILTVYPCHVFHMTPEKALQLEVSPTPGTHVKRLDIQTGTTFITNNWDYKKDGTATAVGKAIESLPSGGVFLDGEGNQKPVCGAIVPGYGHLSMLHTDSNHRRKGYASLVVRFIFQEMAKEGLQPSLGSLLDNGGGNNFYLSVGLTPVDKMTLIIRGH